MRRQTQVNRAHANRAHVNRAQADPSQRAGAPRVWTLLGVESSCDETAAAVVRGAVETRDGAGDVAKREILSSAVWDQTTLHAQFGGVVPEIAARAHAERLDPVIGEALERAGATLDDLDAVAVTAGPGLIGGVLTGVVAAKALAAPLGLPLLGINHLEGHALSPRLSDGIAYPYLLLLVSGGHCQLLLIEALGRYRRLGGSLDDAPGEIFDKLAKHLGLGFPGGPEIERWAERGDPARFALPRPLLDRPGADMSFSGLKTAARLAADALVRAQDGLYDEDVADLAASFQAAVAETLTEKTRRAIRAVQAASAETEAPLAQIAVAGGVAANRTLRRALETMAAAEGLAFAAPPLALCTDNAAMIAWAGLERLACGALPEPESVVARPRWPLDPTATPLVGGGKRGAKA